MSKTFGNRIFSPLALLIGLWIVVELVTRFIGEWLWFQDVGYLPVLLLRLQTQLGLWTITFFPSVVFLFGNLAIAQRLKYSQYETTQTIRKNNYPTPKSFGLRWLLTLIILLCVLAGLILGYYLYEAVSIWQPQFRFPPVFQLQPWMPVVHFLHQIGQLSPFPIPYWQVAVIVGLSIALGLGGLSTAILAGPYFWLRAIALAISLSIALVASLRWDTVLKYFYPTSFNGVDPLFERDISFYVFSLPVWELLRFWILGLSLYGLVAVTLTYLLTGNTLSQGKFPGFSLAQIRHLDVLGSFVCGAIALHYWLGRYQLLYSARGAIYGASYTDVTVNFPVYTVLSLGSAAISFILLWQAVFSTQRRSPLSPLRLGGSFISGAVVYVAVIAVATYTVPAIVQRLVVEPNELARETPYIQRSINYTRQAFDLTRIEAQTFNPQPTLTAADLQENDLTIRNIRLWDTRPLLQTNRQLQQIRTYYSFPNADIDRYTLLSAVPGETTERRQTIIAAREIDYNAVPQQAQTWVNQHLVYTHGYGFTLSPVNTVAAGGLPDYFIQNIGDPGTGEDGALEIANEQIRASIPIGQPRIYYGEISNTYIMTSTRVQELDYPSGNENVYTTYDGRGGINIGSFWRRLLFAQYLKDWQMLLTQDFTPQTRLVFRRNIRNRVQAIAPFLRYDRDAYLVAADGGNTTLQGEPTYLYWILDAYTTSDHYPYSDPVGDDFNYIRNSVKVVIDAYNGSVDFYVADPTDPVIQTIAAIFPGLLKPLDAMPAALRSHIRYPIDLFSTQSEHLLTYHMTDAQVFYNREDLWRIPTEIYGTEPQQVQPYFLITRIPTEETEEFILLLPFNPVERPNLIGWLAARADGEQYGRLLLYEFPKQLLVYGPEQVEARINQDPVISQQISLWNRQGSRVIQGNLLVIPIEESLLYVEPLYLEAEQNSLPTFVRVIVTYENRIVMAETLQQALDAIFQPEITPATPIIRPVEEN
ncbi:UPF0182 family protein [Gloeocapsopsis dulcis]|uniref:UPF0182 protein BWI75_07795 n=1 Tax=Gloeocapsopsis dulcis AAB1 = 1H9 TaxID=1433147 RepID=A0A6N8FTR5_9CHRO|nr:UPF0182 family protein [Gloeocapsopsis dulcis]MUL36249.1 hypothetical protein [Gloeocapsopsis dulcis AAB1 = 1H9]WNN89638.1 UPF0182 family protein [Gloeocapsopsis dulcis]